MTKKVAFNRELVHSLSISFIKLILMPAIFFGVFYKFHIGKDFNVSIIESAMPLAITPFALAEIYPLNKQVIAISIFFSTTFSILTLTFLVSILNL